MTDGRPEAAACRAAMAERWESVAAFLHERDPGERMQDFFRETPEIAIHRVHLALAAATSYDLARGDLETLAGRWRASLAIVRERAGPQALGNFRMRLRSSVMTYCRLHDRSYEESEYGF